MGLGNVAPYMSRQQHQSISNEDNRCRVSTEPSKDTYMAPRMALGALFDSRAAAIVQGIANISWQSAQKQCHHHVHDYQVIAVSMSCLDLDRRQAIEKITICLIFRGPCMPCQWSLLNIGSPGHCVRPCCRLSKYIQSYDIRLEE